MVRTAIDAELALDIRCELGEGPLWDHRAACLYFVDILKGHVHRYDPASSALRTFHAGQPAGAVGLAANDRLVVAVRDGFARLDGATGSVTMIAHVKADASDLRMNDGNCDPWGCFWAGTMALDERPGAGALYRLSPDGRVESMVRPVSISNGVDWTADRRRMYFIDSPTQSVDVFDVDGSGGIANRRTFVAIPVDAGVPDGLTVDADECVWVALWGGSAVHRYTPAGRLDAIVRAPVTHPTSVAFGGSDLRDLYITTANIALSASERARQPHAGSLFRCRPGCVGRRARVFAG